MDGQVDRKSDIEVGAPPKNEGYFKTQKRILSGFLRIKGSLHHTNCKTTHESPRILLNLKKTIPESSEFV